MEQAAPWFATIPIPALLRHARSTYGAAMRKGLAEAGFDDIPGNGLYVIGGLALGAEGAPLGRLAKELGVSKQAAGQLVDTLVMRGYLERAIDAEDRRKLNVTLTERGLAAANAQAAARQRVDDALAAQVGAETVAQLRRGLAALIGLGRDAEPVGEH